MKLSKSTCTHLIYQFIILTLLLLGNGFKEILPDLKIVLFLVSLAIFCYQLVILTCCADLMPIPPWMSFLKLESKENNKEKLEEDFASTSSPAENKTLSTDIKTLTFPEVSGVFPYARRWEKSVTDLGASPKYLVCPQKSKSWVNLSDSRSSERLSLEEGPLDTIAPLKDKKSTSVAQMRSSKTRNRKERTEKSKSWKNDISNSDGLRKIELTRLRSFSKKRTESLSSDSKDEESELEKSYSFPFRQKRLQSWLEMKEPNIGKTNQNPDTPYWQSVGYNLAVKYEARRRQRAQLNLKKTDPPRDSHNAKPAEDSADPSSADKPNLKKSSKSATACMNKIKVGFSNLISKKRDESMEDGACSNKVAKLVSYHKLKNKGTTCQEKDQTVMPEFPQFLSNDRPLFFYPKHIPFEKERFESDVKKKMIELAGEQKIMKI